MKISFHRCVVMLVYLIVVRPVTGRIECYTRLDDDRRSCLTLGKFRTQRTEDCCSFANATGFTDTSSWLIFPEFYNMQKKVSCESCTTTFESTKNWCFAYRNPSDMMCVHIPNYSTIQVQNERDCCLWANASGYTDAPNWRWSNDYGRFYTTCSSCDKSNYVTCYAKFHEDALSETVCEEPQQRLATTPNECCRRHNVTGYAPRNGIPGSRMCHPCPVDGGWSAWSIWSQCSASCGGSIRRRQRHCNSPVPRFGGSACFGSQEQREACRVPPRCPGVDAITTNTGLVWPDRSGIWSRWSPFSDCSVTCGTGSVERRRNCLTDNNHRLPCPGESYETRPCEAPNCPAWAAPRTTVVTESVNQTWSSWSPCHVSCGYGIRSRVKLCPQEAGEIENRTKCPNDDPEIEVCHQPPCSFFLGQAGSASSPGLIAAWSTTAVVCTALFIGVAIFSCRKWRCYERYDPRFLGQRPRAGSKVRFDRGQLPPIPATAPTLHYSSMTDLNRRYVPDPYNRPDSCLDDDGYEIPRPYDDDSPNGRPFKSAVAMNQDHTASAPQLQSWDSVLMLNHVYEQVDFDIDHVTHTGSKARTMSDPRARCE